jgi:hypothetical protein
MVFHYPTGSDWALFVWNHIRPLSSNIQSSIFTWFTLNAPIPVTYNNSDIEQAVQTSGFQYIFNAWMPNLTDSSYNYYIQSNGRKWSNTVQVSTVFSPVSDTLPLGNCCLMWKMGGPLKEKHLAPMRLPLIPEAFTDAHGRWTFTANSVWQAFIFNFVPGFNLGGGVHFSPAVYSIKTDSFTPITGLLYRPRPYYLRRRRFRTEKQGHVVTAPLNNHVVGHW